MYSSWQFFAFIIFVVVLIFFFVSDIVISDHTGIEIIAIISNDIKWINQQWRKIHSIHLPTVHHYCQFHFIMNGNAKPPYQPPTCTPPPLTSMLLLTYPPSVFKLPSLFTLLLSSYYYYSYHSPFLYLLPSSLSSTTDSDSHFNSNFVIANQSVAKNELRGERGGGGLLSTHLILSLPITYPLYPLSHLP